jgi:hypothetical protein
VFLLVKMMSHIKDIFPMLGADMGKSDGRNPSATKKGPGRKPVDGHKKGKAKRSAFQKAQAKVKVAAQTANVTNTPLKAAARGS